MIGRIANVIFVAFCFLVLLPIGLLQNLLTYIFTGRKT